MGGSGSDQIAPITISPSDLSGGSYDFTISPPQDINNAVITATITVTADVGSNSGVNTTNSTSVIIGNPPTGCFVFGQGGETAGYGKQTFTSVPWGNYEGNVIAAIAQLQRSTTYRKTMFVPAAQ